MANAISRRDYLRDTGLWTGGPLTAGYSATAAGYVANETINVGCIGTGSRTILLLEEFKKVAGVRIVGLCDIWDKRIEQAKSPADPKAEAESISGGERERCEQTSTRGATAPDFNR